MKNNPKIEYKTLQTTELIEKCKSNDHFALEELIKRNERVVYSTLYHLDPNRTDLADLAQEVFYRMAKSIKNLRNPATFKFWLNQIITNLFYDELRRKTRRLITISMDAPYMDINEQDSSPTRDIQDSGQKPEESTLSGELDKIIKDAISNLPEQFRVVIVLRELQGLSYDEISELTKTSVGTVKSRLARARGKLQEYIKPYLHFER